MRGGKNLFMIQWKIAKLIIGISFLVFFWGGSNCQAASLQSLNDDAKPKVIYVIYDNSTSMIRDDDKSLDPDKRYTTRWVEASYGIQALATMMNQNDILRIYPISNSGPGEAIRLNQHSLQEVLDIIEQQTDVFGYTGDTIIESVQSAAQDIRKSYNSQYDYWIVIMTDGMFRKEDKEDKEEEKEVDNEDKEEKAKELLENTLDEIRSGNVREPISVAYIYISGESDTVLAEIKGDGEFLFVPDEDAGNAITSKMTNIANKIYKRVAIKSIDNYVGSEGESVKIELKIPVERVLIFTQYTDGKQLYEPIMGNLEAAYVNIEPDKGVNGQGGLEELQNYPIPIMGTCKELTPKEDFHTTPEDTPNISLMQYRYIKGNMHVLTSADAYKNFKNQSISVEGYKDDGIHSIDVYYKPAATVGVSYYQGGRPISHTEECSKRTDSTESCLSEGETIIRVDILANDESKELVDEYRLLYPEDFQVSLYKDSVGNGEEVPLGIIDVDNLKYQCDLEKGTYELQIVTSWNEVYKQTLEVQDRWQPVDLELYETDSIWLESAEKPFCEVKIRASSGGDVSDEEVLGHVVDVDLRTDNELFYIDKLGQSGNGIWSFRVTLKNPEEHDVGTVLLLDAVAETDYRTAESNEHLEDFHVPIDSGSFELSAEAQAEAAHPFWRLLKGESISINYYCDGIQLTEEQKKGVKVLGECGTEPQEMQKRLKIADTGDIRLEYDPLYWFKHREDTVKLNWTVTYTRWNHLESQEVVIELQIQYLTALAQWGIVVALAASLVWCTLCMVKRKTDSFIPRMKLTLESQYTKSQKILFCRKGMLFLPFSKKSKIKYRDSSGYYPNIDIEIRRNPEGKGYEILNYGELGNDAQYRLNNGRISASNKTISESRELQIADRNGCWHRLAMRR